MARKLQKLINYHSSGTTKLTNEYSSVDFGELVVMHNSSLPLLGIKTNDGEGAANGFAWFIDSASVVSAINSVGGDTLDLRRDLTELSGVTYALSENLTNNYATSSNTVTAIKNAIEGLDVEAITGTSGDTITSISETYGKISASYSPIFIEQSQVNGLEDLAEEVGTNSTNITKLTTGLSATVVSSYATKSEVSGHVTSKLDELDYTGTGTTSKTITALTQTNGLVEATFADIVIDMSGVTGLSSKLETIETNIRNNSTDIGTVSGNVINLSGTVESLSAAVHTTLGTVYHVQGSVADIAELNAITDKSAGDVYNVIAASGTPGEASYIPAGTNYVWTGTAWDPLGGTVDLTGYATSANTHNAITGVQQTINTHIQGNFANVSGLVTSISATVTSDYATKTELQNSFTGLYMTQLDVLPSQTIKYIKEEDGIVTASAQSIAITTSQITDFDTFSTELTGATEDISTLSSATQTIEETANESISAVTTGTVSSADNSAYLANATASGVKIKNDNTNRGVTFDFSELVIDCGDF